MSGICDTCRRKCHARTDGLKACDSHMGGESRWFELFGTPERAARTLHRSTPTCRDCALRDECAKEPVDSNCLIDDYDALLEWLRGDA